jgi:NAD-dependent DNA ligase
MSALSEQIRIYSKCAGEALDIFTKYNRKSIDDRQIDTLIGLAKGMTADGRIYQAEAEVLLTWLIQSRQTTENPVILNLLGKVGAFLEDDELDREEANELLVVLRRVSGASSEIGELAKTTTLPLDDPLPKIEFPQQMFLFTGTCAFGTRKQCQEATEELGGLNAKSVTKKLNYLVLGTYVTDSWAHENYGRKIEKAMHYRDNGIPLSIVPETHWIKCGNI